MCGGGNGKVYPPALYVSGSAVQDGWYTGDPPPGVQKEWLEDLYVRPTKKGVATKVATAEALEFACLKPAREHLDATYGGSRTIIVVSELTFC
jgi:hypothetical protein